MELDIKSHSLGSPGLCRLPRGQQHPPPKGLNSQSRQEESNYQSLAGIALGRNKNSRGIPLLGACAVEARMAQGEVNTCTESR